MRHPLWHSFSSYLFTVDYSLSVYFIHFFLHKNLEKHISKFVSSMKANLSQLSHDNMYKSKSGVAWVGASCVVQVESWP
jgi:hypothetical protein